MNTQTQTINDIDYDPALDIDGEKEKYLTFFVDKQLYSIPSNQVIEIISLTPVTYLPRLPDFIKGVINIRGKVIPLIELQLRLKNTPAVYDEHTCVVVVEIGDNSVGFIVDRVHDVTDISLSQISPPPKMASGNKEREFLAGIAKLSTGIAMILDGAKTISDESDKK